MTDIWVYAATASGLALLAYVATNLDNLLILAGLALSQRDFAPLARGFLLANFVVVMVAALFMAVSYVVPVELLGYLGIVPIALGVRLLLQRPGSSPESDVSALESGSVAMILLGNSVDTIATIGPLFAESEFRASLFIAAGFWRRGNADSGAGQVAVEGRRPPVVLTYSGQENYTADHDRGWYLHPGGYRYGQLLRRHG